MPAFLYEGVATDTTTAKESRVKGILTVDGTLIDASRELRAKNISATKITPQASVSKASRFLKVKTEHQLRFYESMSFLTSLSQSQAVTTCANRCIDKNYTIALRSTAVDLKAGTELDRAMEKHPRYFPPLQVAMIRAGREAAALPETYKTLAAMLDRDYDTSNIVKDALTGPAFLGVLGIGAIIFMFSFFVPRMQELLAVVNRPLPEPTKIVIAISHATLNPWLWVIVIGLILGTYFGWRKGMENQRFALKWDYQISRIPVLGSLIEKTATARIARTLGVLIRAVSPSKAVRLCVPLANSTRHRLALEDVAASLEAGSGMEDAFRRVNAFDEMFVSYIGIGERSTDVSGACSIVAEFLERETMRTTKKLTKAIEPTFTIVLTTIFTIIFFALYLPYLDFIGNIGS